MIRGILPIQAGARVPAVVTIAPHFPREFCRPWYCRERTIDVRFRVSFRAPARSPIRNG
jgi:hypothetical protein